MKLSIFLFVIWFGVGIFILAFPNIKIWNLSSEVIYGVFFSGLSYFAYDAFWGRLRGLSPASKFEAKKLNEQLKLFSTFLNSGAVVLFGASIFKPFVDGWLPENFRYSLFLFVFAMVFHMLAQSVLGNLKDDS